MTEATVDRIPVELGDRTYTVSIGSGVRHELHAVLAGLSARRVAVVSARAPEWTPDPGCPALIVPIAEGESIKTLGTVEDLCRRFAGFGLTRADAVVACGGGTVTDTVGLAAALYHRGINVIHMPTSLLAQVDAGVGGKTAVNLPGGKNLVGAYWQPAAVLCDTDYLTTLPPRERRNGFGELARCHFIGVPGIGRMPLREQIVASVRLKASIVSADERDTGLRHILNYGHTLGHALERATDFRVRHGEAVAVGTHFAGRLAHALSRISAAREREHLEVLDGYGLDTALPAGVSASQLLTLMRADKKATADMAFVLDGPAGAELVEGIDAAVVRSVLETFPRQSTENGLSRYSSMSVVHLSSISPPIP